ncbi:hypothetical protein AURDEDRAFT_172447 [Auricularia subglabra TFB-10046 SS5]|nr:hypothetical protein AURDEDRAFT_172447 [Auricularia subglabra TFB-10046 SS5]
MTNESLPILSDHCSTSRRELWKHVLEVVYPVIQDHARQISAELSPAAVLPDELLVKIFARLRFEGRVRTAMVCHRWRRVSLDSPAALWCDIPSINDMCTLSDVLARSRKLPITFRHEQFDPTAFPKYLRQYYLRVRALHLVLAHPDPSHVDPSTISLWKRVQTLLAEILQYAKGILESIALLDYREEFSRKYRDLLVLTTPGLRNIELHGFDIMTVKPCAGSPTLRRLKISTPRDYFELTQEDWATLLSFPALEALGVRLTCVTQALLLRRTPFPISLRSLHLDLFWNVLHELVESEDLTRFQLLRISFLDAAASELQLANLQQLFPKAVLSASVYFESNYWSLRTIHEHGQEIILQRLSAPCDWWRLVPKVQKLSVSENVSPPGGQAATLAVLTSLRELTLDVAEQVERWIRPPPMREWPPISCPGLQTVRFASAGPRIPVPVDKITACLENLLGSRRIRRLVFDLVSPTASPGVDLAAVLRKYAETVYMELSDNTWAEEHWSVWGQDWWGLSDCHDTSSNCASFGRFA